MIEKTEGFLADQSGVDQIAENILDEGICIRAQQHRATLAKRTQKLAQLASDERKAVRQHEIMVQERREARKKRELDNTKQALRDEIFKLFIKPGEVQSPVATLDLIDMHGNYQKATGFSGSFGGHIQQLYYVIATIMEKFEGDLTAFYERSREDPIAANKAADTPRELLLERFFLPFLLHYIKDLKCD